jgi:hypothetical protein
VVLPWRTYERLIKRQGKGLTNGKEANAKAEARCAEKPPQGATTETESLDGRA